MSDQPQVLDYAENSKYKYSVGTLRYTTGTLIITCGWMIWGSICFTLMQTVFPNVMPLQLQEIGAPNQAMALLARSIPALLAFLLVPVISYISDRHRGRWGRRRPFILATAPFTVLFLVSLAYVKDISNFMHAHAATLSHWHISPLYAALFVIGFLVVGFMFFDDFVNSVGWYLIADVIPIEVMGRFNSVSSLVGTGISFFWSTQIFPHSLTHTKLIYAGMGALYFFGYGLMCVMVKEGEYPPVDPDEARASRVAQAVAFFRESFKEPLFLYLFLFNAVWAISNACSTWTIFFFTKTVGLSLHQLGHDIGGKTIVLAAIVTIPAGLAVDWITPVRALIIATVILIPATFASYYIYGYHAALVVALIGSPINTLWGLTTQPMMMQLLPRSKYGQFSAANSMVTNLIRIGIANVGAFYLDLLHNDYRKIFIWQCSWMVVGLIVLFMVYRLYKKHGGPHNYVAPDPGFEEAAPGGFEVANPH